MLVNAAYFDRMSTLVLSIYCTRFIRQHLILHSGIPGILIISGRSRTEVECGNEASKEIRLCDCASTAPSLLGRTRSKTTSGRRGAVSYRNQKEYLLAMILPSFQKHEDVAFASTLGELEGRAR